MCKSCSNVCNLCPCLVTESTNSARMRTIVTAALQRQYSQMELIFWINLVPVFLTRYHGISLYETRNKRLAIFFPKFRELLS